MTEDETPGALGRFHFGLSQPSVDGYANCSGDGVFWRGTQGNVEAELVGRYLTGAARGRMFCCATRVPAEPRPLGSRPTMSFFESLSDLPPAYLITFHTYGSWLHGEAKGSVDRKHNRSETDFAPADKRRLVAMQRRMSGDAISLGETQRRSVEQAITGVCQHRDWDLLAINVRTNHVHVVIAAPVEPEKVMNDLKAWATRKLREAKLFEADIKIWSRHGSTRYLWNERAIENACRYVIEGQGARLFS